MTTLVMVAAGHLSRCWRRERSDITSQILPLLLSPRSRVGTLCPELASPPQAELPSKSVCAVPYPPPVPSRHLNWVSVKPAAAKKPRSDWVSVLDLGLLNTVVLTKVFGIFAKLELSPIYH